MLDGRIRAARGLDAKADARRPDRHRLQQRPESDLARAAVQVVHALVARVVAVDDDVVGSDPFEAPRLLVVTARRPTREVQDRGDAVGLAAGGHARLPRAS